MKLLPTIIGIGMFLLIITNSRNPLEMVGSLVILAIAIRVLSK